MIKAIEMEQRTRFMMEGHDCLKTNKNLCLLTAVRYVPFKG